MLLSRIGRLDIDFLAFRWTGLRRQEPMPWDRQLISGTGDYLETMPLAARSEKGGIAIGGYNVWKVPFSSSKGDDDDGYR